MDNTEYLKDHQVFNHVIFPGAGFVELMLAVVSDQNLALSLSDISIDCALKLDEGRESEIQVIQSGENDQGQVVVYSAMADGNWQQHASSKTSTKPFELDLMINLKAYRSKSSQLQPQEFYQSLSGEGIYYGAAFEVIKEIYHSDEVVLARIETNQKTISYMAHPVILDR